MSDTGLENEFKHSTTYCHTRQNTNFSYDSFIFVDNLTNSRMNLKDVRSRYQHRQKESKVSLEQERDFNNLNQCFDTLKSTKLFQMDSLKNKIFKNSHQKSTIVEPQNLLEAKHGLRKLIESSINELNVKQLRKCLSNKDNPINPQIMNLQYISGHKLSKSNVLKLVKRLSKVSHLKQTPKEKIKCQIVDDFEFEEEKLLLDQMDNYINNNMKSNSSYLIKPNCQKQLFEPLYKACSNKKNRENPKSHFRRRESLKTEGVFEVIQVGQRVKQLQKRINKSKTEKSQSAKEKQIIFGVQNNLFFDIEVLLQMQKQLINTQDLKGNNLLHIAAKNRNQQLFMFLLKKAGPVALQLKNHLGRTPMDIARLYGVTSIVKAIQNYSPYED